MPHFDTIIRHGVVVSEAGAGLADLGMSNGVIAAIAPELSGTVGDEIDARGLHLLPGVIDAHVHFNEPGRGDWEGWASGTRALAAGGTTTCFEMPLNASPPTLDAPSFDAKHAAASAAALTDFALWGGLVPGNVPHLAELAARGVIGFKAFMSKSGMSDFPAADDATLAAGMAEAASLGRIVAVHAENDGLTTFLTARASAAGRTTWRDYLASRPAIAEIEATNRAIALAEGTGCALHIVHLSTGRAVALVVAAKARGVDVSCETCPHYLVFTEEDLERLGAAAKCAPPLRSAAERDALWTALLAGELPMVASDHSPAPPALKSGANALTIWGGIAGCQTLLTLLLTEGHHARKMPLEAIASVSAAYVARRFALPAKGRLATGADADIALVDLAATTTLTRDDLHDRHRLNPFVGHQLRGRVVRTMLRGGTVYHEGKFGPVPR
nr:allantoinase AllB [Chloroflexia bacterium]